MLARHLHSFVWDIDIYTKRESFPCDLLQRWIHTPKSGLKNILMSIIWLCRSRNGSRVSQPTAKPLYLARKQKISLICETISQPIFWKWNETKVDCIWVCHYIKIHLLSSNSPTPWHFFTPIKLNEVTQLITWESHTHLLNHPSFNNHLQPWKVCYFRFPLWFCSF